MQENIIQNRFKNKQANVAIVILKWNGKEDTIECLESLKHITYPNYEILLVDNGSTDGSVECFRERYPGMEIIDNENHKICSQMNHKTVTFITNKLLTN
ncbi:MAG: glycosyltransferase [ANME-2 cluster archaeon]|nr:glycosyltransferase [ANME-2 cluster archaeon]MBC2747069.1 glycosyltransferase [ANME-2 cluster archaeon]